jgi:hypothetical protein
MAVRTPRFRVGVPITAVLASVMRPVAGGRQVLPVILWVTRLFTRLALIWPKGGLFVQVVQSF